MCHYVLWRIRSGQRPGSPPMGVKFMTAKTAEAIQSGKFGKQGVLNKHYKGVEAVRNDDGKLRPSSA